MHVPHATVAQRIGNYRRRNEIDPVPRDGAASIEDVLYGGTPQGNVARLLESKLKGISFKDLYSLKEENNGNGHPILKAHTNSILEYFGFRDGNERAGVLKRYDYVADAIRTAYHLSVYFGLAGNHDKTDRKTKDTFLAIADSVHRYGTANTDLIIERVGLERLPEFMEASKVFSIVDVFGVPSFVPSKRVQIESRGPETSVIRSPWAEWLKQNGYSPRTVNGFPFYGRLRLAK
ncbi:hypothetical protein HYS31_04795 [Candidatus Woesearchaeota archaeon]|nr:hypothetical protein [Candidatus Woesearchaeota archaeon]